MVVAVHRDQIDPDQIAEYILDIQLLLCTVFGKPPVYRVQRKFVGHAYPDKSLPYPGHLPVKSGLLRGFQAYIPAYIWKLCTGPVYQCLQLVSPFLRSVVREQLPPRSFHIVY